MQAYCTGDAQAFAELYQRYAGRLYAYCLKKTANPQEANDLLQAIFTHLHVSRFKYEPKYPFPQWLFVMARNIWIDRVRKTGREVMVSAEIDLEQLSQNTPSGTLTSIEDVDGYEDRLKPLNSEQRRIVTMRVVEEQSFEDISRSLGKTEVSVRQILSRALRKLRKATQGGEA